MGLGKGSYMGLGRGHIWGLGRGHIWGTVGVIYGAWVGAYCRRLYH